MDLSNNSIETFPEELNFLRGLKLIHVLHNPFLRVAFPALQSFVKNAMLPYNATLKSLNIFDFDRPIAIADAQRMPLSPWMHYMSKFHGSHGIVSGTVPSQVGLLKALEYMDLTFNNLTGYIPSELGKLAILSHLDLSMNVLVALYLLSLPTLET